MVINIGGLLGSLWGIPTGLFSDKQPSSKNSYIGIVVGIFCCALISVYKLPHVRRANGTQRPFPFGKVASTLTGRKFAYALSPFSVQRLVPRMPVWDVIGPSGAQERIFGKNTL